MIWKRVILSWLTLLALAFPSASATATADVSPKSPVRAIEQAATLSLEAHAPATAQEQQKGRPEAKLASTSEAPKAQYGYDQPGLVADQQQNVHRHYVSANQGYDAATNFSSLARLPPSRAPPATSTMLAPTAARGGLQAPCGEWRVRWVQVATICC